LHSVHFSPPQLNSTQFSPTQPTALTFPPRQVATTASAMASAWSKRVLAVSLYRVSIRLIFEMQIYSVNGRAIRFVALKNGYE
jgi:hypothetical protein